MSCPCPPHTHTPEFSTASIFKDLCHGVYLLLHVGSDVFSSQVRNTRGLLKLTSFLNSMCMKWTCWLWHWPGTQKSNDSTQWANEKVMVQARTRIRRKWEGTSWRIQKLRVCFCPVFFLANIFPQPLLPCLFRGIAHSNSTTYWPSPSPRLLSCRFC